jgi:hypothetical protein
MRILDHRFRSAKADGADGSQVQPSNWNDGHAFSGGAAGQVLVRDPTDAAYGAAWAPYGQWTAITFTAAMFHAIGGMVWTVPPANTSGAYMLTGKTCVLSWAVNAGTLSGASGPFVYFDLPAAVPTPVGSEINLCRVAFNWVFDAGTVFIQPGTRAIQISNAAINAMTLGEFQTQGQLLFQVA